MPAVVLVRQESVEIVDEYDVRATAAGLVTRATRAGTRQVATVTLDPSTAGAPAAPVLVELAPGVPAPVGSRVGVRLTGPLVPVPAPSELARLAPMWTAPVRVRWTGHWSAIATSA